MWCFWQISCLEQVAKGGFCFFKMLTKSAFKDTITRDTFLKKKPIHWNLSTWQVGNIQKLGWVQLVDCYSLVRLALRGLAQFSFFEREGVLVDWLGDWLDNKAGVLVLITKQVQKSVTICLADLPVLVDWLDSPIWREAPCHLLIFRAPFSHHLLCKNWPNLKYEYVSPHRAIRPKSERLADHLSHARSTLQNLQVHYNEHFPVLQLWIIRSIARPSIKIPCKSGRGDLSTWPPCTGQLDSHAPCGSAEVSWNMSWQKLHLIWD